jgi:3-hydroxypropanoate dehydrogenase
MTTDADLPVMPDDAALQLAARRLFSEARSFGAWRAEPVSPAQLRGVIELAQWGPTSMNSQPMRLQFAASDAARRRLADCVNPGNVAKVLSAPVVAIVGMEMAFADTLARLFAHKSDARAYYDGKPDVVASTALRNSSLQGAYLMLAARLVGLDCGPMSGFDAAAVDRAFWTGSTVRTNFLCALGQGERAALKPRQPRLAFDEVARIV